MDYKNELNIIRSLCFYKFKKAFKISEFFLFDSVICCPCGESETLQPEMIDSSKSFVLYIPSILREEYIWFVYLKLK